MGAGAKRFCNFLCEEIVEQILRRLQCTKTILRCTSVCKSWCSLIKSSQFINTHLSCPNHKYLLCKDIFYSLHSDSVPSEQCCTLVFPNRLKKHINIHGCCNGVICYTKLRGNRNIIYLWNPNIRKLKVLPEFQELGYLNYALGFWFNAEKDDYEVAKIVYTAERSFIEVYSLSSSSWKMINETCPRALKISDVNLVYAKGKLHWLAEQEQGCIIVSLDMNNNAEFRDKLISGWYPTGTKFYLTRVHADFLALLRWNVLGRPHYGCVVEVYDENHMIISRHLYGEHGTDETLFPVGVRNNGEALLLQMMPGTDKMLSYDFSTKQFKDFAFFGQSLCLRPFVKSLVLLNDSDVRTTTAPVSGNKCI